MIFPSKFPAARQTIRLGVYEIDSKNHLTCSSLAEIAQLGERQTEDLKVPGSNPEGSREP